MLAISVRTPPGSPAAAVEIDCNGTGRAQSTPPHAGRCTYIKYMIIARARGERDIALLLERWKAPG